MPRQANTQDYIIKTDSHKSETLPSVKPYYNFKSTGNQKVKQRKVWDILARLFLHTGFNFRFCRLLPHRVKHVIYETFPFYTPERV